ncbi:hypothetical protein QOZ80_7BG0600610 [Eleusine coracana subsp. coracana]|nr:hypothetical protein QOZ80_7BG0600610 [Eleusine coracana subsp. coracana]
MPSMTVPSAAMRRLRRERDCSRMKAAALAVEGGISKKPAESLLVADIKKKNPSPVRFCVGARVRVRTPTRPLRSGGHLVFWLHAVVVDAGEEEDDDYIKVIYCGSYEHPDSDPMGVVRVLKKDVKNMVQRAAASGSSDVTTSHSGAGDEVARRPTVGGKTPTVLKKIIEAAMPTTS